jgi:hypothetical protein
LGKIRKKNVRMAAIFMMSAKTLTFLMWEKPYISIFIEI